MKLNNIRDSFIKNSISKNFQTNIVIVFQPMYNYINPYSKKH